MTLRGPSTTTLNSLKAGAKNPLTSRPGTRLKRSLLTHPGLRRRRIYRALVEILDELASLGVVTRLRDAFDAQPERHGVNWPGRGDSVPVPWHAPEPPAKAYELSRLHREDASAELAPLDPVPYLVDLRPLLGERGMMCAAEALRAWRRHLYLASVNLLGAASESAWYGLGELLRNGNDQLGRAVDEDRTARVIELTGQKLRERGVISTDVFELTTHAIYLRQLRNYGSHPRSQRDPDLEATFTEGASAVLLSSTRRYFVRMIQAATRAGVDLG
jgi:hypothetical protein